MKNFEDTLEQFKRMTQNRERELAPELQDTLIGRPVEQLDDDAMIEEPVREAVNDIVENPYTVSDEKQEETVSKDIIPSGELDVEGLMAGVRRDLATPAEPTPTLSRQERLLQELNNIREESNRQLKEAREDENRSRLIAGLGASLAQYAAGDLQSSSGANIRVPEYRGVKPSDIELTDDVIQDRDDAMKQALEQYKLMQPNANIKQIGNRLVRINEDGTTDILLDAPKKEGMTEYQRQKLELERSVQEGRLARKDQLRRKTYLDSARALLKDDKRAQKSLDQAMEFESVQTVLESAKSGNEAAVAALGTKLARAMGEVGVLTDTDVVRYVQGTSWGRKLKDWYKRGMEGELSEDTINDIEKNISTIEKVLNKNLKNVYDNAENRLINAYPELSKKDARGLLGNPTRQTKKTTDKVNVMLTRTIDRDNLDKFKQKYPNAKIIGQSEKGANKVKVSVDGKIDRDKLDKFKEKYPDATIME